MNTLLLLTVLVLAFSDTNAVQVERHMKTADQSKMIFIPSLLHAYTAHGSLQHNVTLTHTSWSHHHTGNMLHTSYLSPSTMADNMSTTPQHQFSGMPCPQLVQVTNYVMDTDYYGYPIGNSW